LDAPIQANQTAGSEGEDKTKSGKTLKKKEGNRLNNAGKGRFWRVEGNISSASNPKTGTSAGE